MKEENQMPETISPDATDTTTNTPPQDSPAAVIYDKETSTPEDIASQPVEARSETTSSPSEAAAEPATADTTPEPIVASEPVQPATEAGGESSTARSFSPVQLIVGAVVIIVFVIGLIYLLEQRGVINTSFFAGMEQARMERTVVAVVDGEEITEYDLSVSIEQQAAAAAAQGIDPTDPVVAENIRTQALTLLVNTELLKNEAFSRGLSVSDTDAMERYDELVAEVGGEEVLRERMGEFGVTEEILQRDIRDELLIQQLVDQLFENNEITVTTEEAREVYENAGGAEAGLPPFGEVQPQIVDQITVTKEQELVNGFVEELRSAADIQITSEV
jgi:peptidyl-prolyl cis-trans isomerase SurA